MAKINKLIQSMGKLSKLANIELLAQPHVIDVQRAETDETHVPCQGNGYQKAVLSFGPGKQTNS